MKREMKIQFLRMVKINSIYFYFLHKVQIITKSNKKNHNDWRIFSSSHNSLFIHNLDHYFLTEEK